MPNMTAAEMFRTKPSEGSYCLTYHRLSITGSEKSSRAYEMGQVVSLKNMKEDVRHYVKRSAPLGFSYDVGYLNVYLWDQWIIVGWYYPASNIVMVNDGT